MSYSGFSSNSDNPYAGGGRVILLFLLFLLSLYSLSTQGLTGFAITFGALPIMAIVVALALHYQMFTFWALFIINYFVSFMSRMGWLPIPTSVPNEALEMLCLALAIIDAGIMRFEKIANAMGLAMLIWFLYCVLELLNNSCDLGFNFGVWYAGFRLIALQLVYAFIVCSIYIDTPKKLINYIRLWAILALFASFWTWKQQTFGFNDAEKVFLIVAARTHMVNGIVRFFSIFTDAASCGINMAATAVMFYIIAITSKLKRDKIFFLITALACTKTMFASGTRTAMFCLIIGFMVYVVLSKSVKIAVSVTISGILFLCFMMFTTIGNGNNEIRRMRSAFNRNDASAGVRETNQAVIAKYMQDAPWGIGIGVDYKNVPSNNKFRSLATIPPDSEYVYIWVHTGPIGITIFLICQAMMWLGACCIVFFSLKNRALQGIGAGFCAAFVAFQLGGYGNQILMQFPNTLLFYGSLAIVYCLPRIEKEYEEIEDKKYAEQLERERKKEEKEKAKRVKGLWSRLWKWWKR